MKTILRVQEFEARLVPAVAIDSAYETYAWVFINTLRRDPDTFADNLDGLRTGNVSNAFGFSASDAIVTDLKGMINRASVPAHYNQALTLMRSTAAAGPLAWDELLENRAGTHNNWMRTNGFEHTEANSGNRFAIPGYTKNNFAAADTWGYSGQYSEYGENIGYAVGSLGATKAAYNAGTITLDGFRQRAAFLDTVAYMLELNSGTLGHLENLLGRDKGTHGILPSFNAIGFDTDLYEAPGAYEVQDGIGEAYLSTQRLALYRPGDTGGFVAGVVYNDANGNGYYDVGEGIPATVDVRNGAVGFTDTLTATHNGAFSGYVANGTYTVTISAGATVLDTMSVSVSNGNAWAEFPLGGIGRPTVNGPVGSKAALRPQVAWGAVEDATGYQIRIDNRITGAMNILGTATTAATSWTPTADLVSGHNYRVWVRAMQGTIAGPWSDPKDFSVAIPTKTVPTGTVADLRPTFAWTAVTGANYRVRVDDVTTNQLDIFPGLAFTGTSGDAPADLVSGRTYRWRVIALNSLNQGVSSSFGSFIVGTPVLTSPSIGVAKLRPSLSWSSVFGATNYEVRLNDLSAKKNNIFPGVIIAGTNWTPTGDLVSGRSYNWVVRALNSSGVAMWSKVGTFSVGRPIPSGPTGNVNDRTPTFTWTPITGATTYRVKLDDVTTGMYTLYTVAGTTWTPPADLVVGHNYRFAVAAINSLNQGVVSTPLNLKIV